MEQGNNERVDFAYHEAGHAVVAYLHTVDFNSVTLKVDDDYGGRVDYQNPVDGIEVDGCDQCRDRSRREIWAKIFLSGPEAERHFNPKGHWRRHAKQDLCDTLTKLSSDTTPDKESKAYLRLIQIRTQSILKRPDVWDAVETLAKALLEEETLSGKKAEGIIEQAIGQSRARFDERLRERRCAKRGS